MTPRQDAPAETGTEPAAPVTAEVREIYPGARRATPVQAREHTKGRRSEAGMATAEYAIATLAAVRH
jgi:hypothetical protein